MIPVNYHHLYYFWNIAKAGSFTAAGKPLLLAQSTLSLQMSQLERAMGRQLLNRDPKGVSLTPPGQTVFSYCERIFTEGEELASRVRSGLDASPAVMRLGIDESISSPVLLAVMRFVARRDPDVRVTIFGGSTDALKDRLRRHALDMLVATSDYSRELSKDFKGKLAAGIPIGFVATPEIAGKMKKFPSALNGFPILVRSAGNPIRREVDAYLRKRRVAPVIKAEIENPYLLRALTLQGEGVAAIDTLPFLLDLQAGRLVTLHKSPTGLKEHIWLIYNSRPKANRRLQTAIERIIRAFKIEIHF